MLIKSDKIFHLTPKDFSGNKLVHDKIKSSKGLILFGTGWCKFCVNFAPVLEKTVKILGNSFPVFYVDCEKYSELSKSLEIQGYPTIMFVNSSGKMYKKYTGDRTVPGLLNTICDETQVCSNK